MERAYISLGLFPLSMLTHFILALKIFFLAVLGLGAPLSSDLEEVLHLCNKSVYSSTE